MSKDKKKLSSGTVVKLDPSSVGSWNPFGKFEISEHILVMVRIFEKGETDLQIDDVALKTLSEMGFEGEKDLRDCLSRLNLDNLFQRIAFESWKRQDGTRQALLDVQRV